VTDLATYYDESYPPSIWQAPPDGGGVAPGPPADGSLTPAEIVWWHRTSDHFSGVSIGPPASGSKTYVVDYGDGAGATSTAFTAGAPVNASSSTRYPFNGSYDAKLHEDTAAGAVVSTHTFVITDAVDRKDATVGSAFTDAAVTAEDDTNANTLTALGYVADPQTSWAAGESFTINGFHFWWAGIGWGSGVAEAAQQQTDEPAPGEGDGY
jgi:hypothetical protein